MAEVVIYRPAKTAMQSGRARTRDWVVEFEAGAAQRVDPLMGWAGQGDTRTQVRLSFPSREEAVAYAERYGLSYHVVEPRSRRLRPKSYADNFRTDRGTNWTH